MGTVYRAARADGLYDQHVAVKLLRTPLSGDFLFLRRFRDERRILARLEHPNIARLIDGGVTPEQIPYLVMEFVDGQPIDVYCDRHKLGLQDRLKLFRDVCAAAQCAHQNLVVHRDLKPANILVTAAGAVKLLDFGIARLIDPDHDATQTGVTMMTLQYASPEQVRGEVITTAADIYSLGLILYELLTGKRAQDVSGTSTVEIVKIICEKDPPRPSDLSGRKELRGDLDNIVMKAIQKEPGQRYASVEQMSEDVRRYIAGLPVSARPSTFGYRAAKFVRRNRAATVAAAVAAAALVIGSILTIRQERIAER